MSRRGQFGNKEARALRLALFSHNEVPQVRIRNRQIHRKAIKLREYVLCVLGAKRVKANFDSLNMKIWLCCGVYWEVHSPFGKPKRAEAAHQQLFAVPREGDTKTQYAPPRVAHR
jgi:hypothetical protein